MRHSLYIEAFVFHTGSLSIGEPIIRVAQAQLEEYARIIHFCLPPRNLTIKRSSRGITALNGRKDKLRQGLAVEVDVTSFQIEYAYGVAVPAEFRLHEDSALSLHCLQRVLIDKVSLAE